MAARFWVGGTGTWDTSSNNWASASGGAAGSATAPTSVDDVTFDGNSGGPATVTVNTNVSVRTFTWGAFSSGTIDFSVNNNNVEITGTGLNAFSGTGTVTRSFSMGSGTWTITSNAFGNIWTMTTTTGLTWSGSLATINLNNQNAGMATFNGGSLTYGNLSILGSCNKGGWTIGGTNVFNSLSISGFNVVTLPNGVTTTVASAVTVAGGSKNVVFFMSNSAATNATLSASAASTINWAGLRTLTRAGAGSFTATNTIDMGSNSSSFNMTGPEIGQAPIFNAGF